MGWISDSFKKDKRYLELQLKRGHIKRKDVENILSDLPDVSSKAEVVPAEAAFSQKGDTPDTGPEQG